MSKTITISDDTYEALKAQIEEAEKKQRYPLASVVPGASGRLVLNIPDKFLDVRYRGMVISIDSYGNLGQIADKLSCYVGDMYGKDRENKVFPKL